VTRAWAHPRIADGASLSEGKKWGCQKQPTHSTSLRTPGRVNFAARLQEMPSLSIEKTNCYALTSLSYELGLIDGLVRGAPFGP